MTSMFAGLRSYEDPISKRQEVWLEANEQKGVKEWLRCRVLGPKMQLENLDVIPVDIQRCIQQIQRGLFTTVQRTSEPMLYFR